MSHQSDEYDPETGTDLVSFPENFCDGVGGRIGRDVMVVGLPVEQQVTNASTGEQGGVSVLDEFVDDEFSGLSVGLFHGAFRCWMKVMAVAP